MEAIHEVINQATQCALAAGGYDASVQPTEVLDMATTGGIPEGYTHLIFVAINKDGYIVSRNPEGTYTVVMHDQVVRPIQ